jgi:hypothetical protein
VLPQVEQAPLVPSELHWLVRFWNVSGFTGVVVLIPRSVDGGEELDFDVAHGVGEHLGLSTIWGGCTSWTEWCSRHAVRR